MISAFSDLLKLAENSLHVFSLLFSVKFLLISRSPGSEKYNHFSFHFSISFYYTLSLGTSFHKPNDQPINLYHK